MLDFEATNRAMNHLIQTTKAMEFYLTLLNVWMVLLIIVIFVTRNKPRYK